MTDIIKGQFFPDTSGIDITVHEEPYEEGWALVVTFLGENHVHKRRPINGFGIFGDRIFETWIEAIEAAFTIGNILGMGFGASITVFKWDDGIGDFDPADFKTSDVIRDINAMTNLKLI
jgi:hypothetical protein